LSEYYGRYGGYSFDAFRLLFVFSIPDLVFAIRGIKAFKVYRKQKTERKRVEKEYHQLFTSGFVKEFQKKEYNQLVVSYKEIMGSDWIEPAEIVKKGRGRR
jgi:hypothetical protein